VSRLPAWARTIRFRLTVAYSSLLFGLAALLVGALYAAVSRNVDAEPITRTYEVQRVVQRPDGSLKQIGAAVESADVADIERAVNYETLSTLRTYSFWALALLFVASLAIGWWLSGRALRPVRRIAAAAEAISPTDLSRRIRLEGPDDELHSLARTLDTMLARFDDAFASQRRLIDDASHELRNPLAVIQTNLDAILARDDVTPEERRRASEVVGRATARMSRLVEDLLASARRSSGAYTDTEVDLSAVVREASEELDLLARERSLRVRRLVDSGAVVSGDHDALRRAVANLLSNAVRLAPAHSEIVVGTGCRSGWCWLAVRDDGPGIDAADQERVFDRFWRADSERGEGHTGLGLAIVRQIAESHGGHVALHSRPGTGSTFVLWLPATLPPESGAGSPPGAPPTEDPLPR